MTTPSAPRDGRVPTLRDAPIVAAVALALAGACAALLPLAGLVIVSPRAGWGRRVIDPQHALWANVARVVLVAVVTVALYRKAATGGAPSARWRWFASGVAGGFGIAAVSLFRVPMAGPLLGLPSPVGLLADSLACGVLAMAGAAWGARARAAGSEAPGAPPR